MKKLYCLLFLCFILIKASTQAQVFVNFTINQDPELTANAGTGGSICPGSLANLSGNVNGGNGVYTYDWSPSASIVDSAALNTTANPSITTPYLFTVTDGNNCSQTDTVVITVLDCSGIEDINPIASFLVYPNPTTGIFTLSTQFLKEGKISITSVIGKLVYTKTILIDGNYQIDLSHLAKGVYIVSVESPSQKISKTIAIQ
jgi:hypothetical protein